MELIKVIDQTLSFNDKKVRVVGTFDEPMFVAKDICDILALKNVTDSLKIIPEKWKKTMILTTTNRGEQNTNLINEAGLYKLIMRSNKPIAEKFQEWVCEDVLPSIRKKGDYVLEEYKQKLEEKQKELENKNQKLIEKQEEIKDVKNKLTKEENLVLRLKKSVANHSKKYRFYHSFKEMLAVYIISDPSKFNQSELKIGFTENINNRLASDRCMIPNLRLEFLMYCPFAVDFEKIIKIRYREQFTNPNHEWLVEPLEKLKKFFRDTNKLLMLNGVEEEECYKYNIEKDEESEEIKEEIKVEKKEVEETKEDFDQEEQPFVVGLKTEILSVRLKKILPGWLLKVDYNAKNSKAPKDKRYCDGWCKKYEKVTEFRGTRCGGLLPVCKKCENMEEIARIKIESGKATIEQIKADPLLLKCGSNDKICRQCLKMKNKEKDFEPNNRKCRQCKIDNQTTRLNKVDYKQKIEDIKQFSKDMNNTPIEIELKIKNICKDELIRIISELNLGRSKDDLKDDMVKKVHEYFVKIRDSI